MCGIFGTQTKSSNTDISKKIIDYLFKQSTLRGQDSSGISVLTDEINTFKLPINGKDFVKNKRYLKFIDKCLNKKIENKFISTLSQCRLTTNSLVVSNTNTQPIEHNDFILVHNGIFLNDQENLEFDKKYDDEFSPFKNDTFSINRLLQKKYNQTGCIKKSYKFLDDNYKGSYSIAFFNKYSENIYLATNNGSLFFYLDKNILIFSSEKFFISSCLKKLRIKFSSKDIVQCTKNKLYIFDELKEISINKKNKTLLESFNHNNVNKIRRCQSCILPETYPYIKFDEKGICNFCLSSENDFKLKDKLEEYLSTYRSTDQNNDCLIGLSGGRDSCYGLHVIKKEFNMNPIAYTYDWGLTSDVSRRNQSLISGKLGVEHIIRSADIRQKRENIAQNVNAWLKKPKLGMVPIFMSGDKDFYQLGRTLKKENNISLTIFCSGQRHEQRNFFVGFCGVDTNVASETSRMYDYKFNVKAKLAFYYIYQFLLNPRYFNVSFLDSIKSFFTTFILKDDFLYLYEYLKWDEKLIEKTLREEYGWESDSNYGKNQWRMGDGQTSFNNYIFNKMAGFTEFDDFRSSQIREGSITRDQALEMIKEDNEPKYRSIKDFTDKIGLNFTETLKKIDLIEPIF